MGIDEVRIIVAAILACRQRSMQVDNWAEVAKDEAKELLLQFGYH